LWDLVFELVGFGDGFLMGDAVVVFNLNIGLKGWLE